MFSRIPISDGRDIMLACAAPGNQITSVQQALTPASFPGKGWMWSDSSDSPVGLRKIWKALLADAVSPSYAVDFMLPSPGLTRPKMALRDVAEQAIVDAASTSILQTELRDDALLNKPHRDRAVTF